MLELAKLIDIIVGFASPMVQNKLQRSEVVIKLLKQLNLDPDHPPADFAAVYQYTLVEYGIGKPKPVLELFRQAQIQEIFRKALDQNNPSLLLKEGEAFLSGHSLGEQIQALGIDARQEFYQFAAVFIEVAKRTRTPAEVLANQKLDSLHQQIGSIQERLHRLPTLEGMRTEMARLAAQIHPVLPEATLNGDLGAIATPAAIQERQFQESQCRAFALAQQMKGWFETLGYRFESYEVWQDDYFEWMIDIPVRRGRYDRILVRGIDGEVGLRDIKALRQSVEAQKADEGWLVTARRISRAAREEVEKEENHDLGCYTFDELLDQDADFGGYLDWLEAEIQRRGIEQKYVPLACTKEEVDPDTKQQMGVSRYDDRDGWIDGYIDLWLDDPAKEHISVLGEFGTGKTWFAFHYASQALQRYREAQQRGLDRPRLPLVIPLRDYAKAVSVESLFSEFFFRKHEVRSLTYSAFEQLNRMGKLLLIFDGFDEMAARVDRQEMINNFWELAKAVVPGAKVILTCRTEHFPEAREGRALLNAELQASTSNLTGETPQFEVLELEKFNDEQIRQVLLLQAESTTVEQVMGNPQLLDLARRPVMTELILEALPDIESGKPVDMSRVYLYAVRRKMERDIKEERTFTSLAEKLYFLCELSWEMLSTNRMSLNYREFPDRIRRLFGSVVQEEKDLDHWHYDMMGQTMLIRNADGDYMPAHRSLLEFFVAYKFAAELGALAPDFLELAQIQTDVDTSLESREYRWSEYFGQRDVRVAPLHRFVSEDLEVLRSGFGNRQLTKAITDLLALMIDKAVELIPILIGTRGRKDSEVGYLGGNTATVIVKSESTALEKCDLSETILCGANLTGASLRLTNFRDANFTGTTFTKNLGHIFSVNFHPTLSLLIIGDSNGIIRIWNFVKNREEASYQGHGGWIWSVKFSHFSDLFASGSRDGEIKLWRTSARECTNTLHGHTADVRCVAFSPDDKFLASSSDDKTIRIWDTSTGACLKILQGHTSDVASVVFSLDGKLIASGSSDKTVRLWDFKSGKSINILHGHIGYISSVRFHPKEHILVSGSFDKTVRVWDVSTGDCLNILDGHTDAVQTLSFAFKGAILVSGSADRTIRLWNFKTAQCVKILHGHGDSIRSIDFDSKTSTIVSGGHDQSYRLWDIHTGECIKTIQGSANAVFSIAFSADGQMLASGSSDGIVRLWDSNKDFNVCTLKGHQGWVNSVTFDHTGKLVISGGDDATLKIWDVESAECLRTLRGHERSVWSVAVHSSNKFIASCSNDMTIRIWDIQTGECLRILSGHTERVWSVCFSPTEGVLASGSWDKTVRLWSSDTGELLSTLEGHDDLVRSVAFSPDGQMIASASSDQKIRLWSLSGESLYILIGHVGVVFSITFSPCGSFLASSSSDQTVKLWDVRSGECLFTFVGHTNSVRAVDFDSTGDQLASCSWDGTIRIWDTVKYECIRVLSDRPYEGMNITRVKGLTGAEKATLKALGAIEH